MAASAQLLCRHNVSPVPRPDFFARPHPFPIPPLERQDRLLPPPMTPRSPTPTPSTWRMTVSARSLGTAVQQKRKHTTAAQFSCCIPPLLRARPRQQISYIHTKRWFDCFFCSCVHLFYKLRERAIMVLYRSVLRWRLFCSQQYLSDGGWILKKTSPAFISVGFTSKKTF